MNTKVNTKTREILVVNGKVWTSLGVSKTDFPDGIESLGAYIAAGVVEEKLQELLNHMCAKDPNVPKISELESEVPGVKRYILTILTEVNYYYVENVNNLSTRGIINSLSKSDILCSSKGGSENTISIYPKSERDVDNMIEICKSAGFTVLAGYDPELGPKNLSN